MTTDSAVYEQVLGVLSKPVEHRSDDEVAQLLPWFRQKCRLFESLDSEIVKDIIRNCDFQKRSVDNVIIKQGDKGECFFILLRGKVSVWINSNLADLEDVPSSMVENDPERSPTRQSQRAAATSSELAHTDKAAHAAAAGKHAAAPPPHKKKEAVAAEAPAGHPQPAAAPKVLQLDRNKFGNCVSQLPAGAGFGELALISKDCVRNASIIVDEEADLVVVNRELYNRSLRKPQEQEFKERVGFVQEFCYFRKWAQRYKRQMAMSLTRIQLPFQSILVKQGEPLGGLYFIRRGEAKVIAEPQLYGTQFPVFFPLPDPEEHEREMVIEEFLGYSAKDTTNRSTPNGRGARDVKAAVRPKSRGVAYGSGDAAGRAPQKQRHVELCLIGTNEVLGELELVMDLGSYVQTVECTEETTAYHLNMRNFERLVVKKCPKTLDIMRERALMVLRCRLDRLPFNRVSFLTHLHLKLRDSTLKAREKANTKPPTKTPSEQASIVPLQGALVNLYGPGTVFYRIRMQDKVMKKKERRKLVEMGGNGTALSTENDNQMPSKLVEKSLQDVKKERNAIETQADRLVQSERDRAERERYVKAHGSRIIDHETSDRALSDLEGRIKMLLTKLNSRSRQSFDTAEAMAIATDHTRLMTGGTFATAHYSDVAVATLERFNADARVFPGKRIVLTKKGDAQENGDSPIEEFNEHTMDDEILEDITLDASPGSPLLSGENRRPGLSRQKTT